MSHVAMRIYVPDAVPNAVRAGVETYLVNKHGGATCYNGRGSWSDGNEIITEDVTIIEVIAEDPSQPATDLKRQAEYIKSASDEDSVMYETREIEHVGFA